MRNRLLGTAGLAVAVLLVVVDASAQTWTLPVRLGWSRASFTGEDRLGSESVNGFVGSVGAALQFNEDLSIEFDLAYAQKGSQGLITNQVANSPSNPPQPGPVFEFEGETALDYLEIWVMFAGHVEVAETAELKAYLGVSLGNLLSAEAEGTFNGEPVKFDLKEGLSNVDFGGLAGLGLAVDVAPVTFTLDFFVNVGMTNIDDSVLDTEIKTLAYYSMLGVEIPLASY